MLSDAGGPPCATDIVTSLRSSAEWIKDLEHESWFGTAELQIEAADLILVQECEIERLRAKVVHLSAWFSFCDHPIECDVCGDVYRSEEARRG